jgi:beta-phosphoglucomutase-like phosphatase (HAD superfamily)
LNELLVEVSDIELTVPLSDVAPVVGGVALVRRLGDVGMPLALVTSAGRRYAHDLLREFGLLDAFATVVTAEDVSRAGVAAVKSAGMGCIAVATTQPRDLLGAADIVIADFEDLEPVGWLREIAGTG